MPLDRELKAVHELQIEAKDQGNPPRSARAIVRVIITDVNDNTPVIVEPEETVVSVREELPAGKEVVRVRAVDTDEGNNATVTYSFVIGEFSFLLLLLLIESRTHLIVRDSARFILRDREREREMQVVMMDE